MTETFVHHCESVYKALDDRAHVQKLVSGDKARVFAGSYSEVWESCNISRTYYAPIRLALEKHNAIQILQRGGRGADTVIVLKGLPERWEVDGWLDGKTLTKPLRSAMLEARVQELENLTGGINVISALVEFEQRVKTLEAQIEELQNKK